MKTNILTLIFLFSIFFAKVLGQSRDVNLGKTFVMVSNYNAVACNGVGTPNAPAASEILTRGFLVIVEAVTANDYVISVPKFDDAILDPKFVEDPAGNKLYFTILKTDFEQVCELFQARNSFTIGVPTVPVKLRFGNGGSGNFPRYFRFEGNLNLGLSLGYKHSLGKNKMHAFNTLLGFTVASVSVDSVTTKGIVNTTTSVASFSPHFGIVFDLYQFQVGIYTGFDFLFDKPNKYWVYKNQPWLGIGIGYSLFKIGGTPSNNKP